MDFLLRFKNIFLPFSMTGVPVLLNTSYNLRGEPIVNTPENVINTFAASDIDQLVMGPFLVKKPEGYQARGSHLSPDQVD